MTTNPDADQIIDPNPEVEMHPRPQLQRAEWTSLDGTWDFAYDDGWMGRTQMWQHDPSRFDRVIQVPFPPESPASGIGDNGYHPVVWYRRVFTHTPAPGRRLHLHFGAVDYRASVWVNGALVMTHEGGHTPFWADITPMLDSSGTHAIVVRAEDIPRDLSQPRGKQDWELDPHAIWYSRTTGIWQPVWLEEVPETYIRSLRWLSDLDRHSLALSVQVTRPHLPGLRLRVRLHLREKLLADDTYAITGDEIQRTIVLPEGDHTLSDDLGAEGLLWSPRHPNLIDANLQLVDDEGVVDEVTSYTALRSISAAHDRLLLNGRPYFLRLVLAQNFWPESHLAAPSAAALRREVELVKELGFNGVRLHQKIEDPRFLAWCDRLGLLVWAEMPAAYEFSRRLVDRLTREWLEVLERDAGHPCLIAWVPINESWGVPALVRSPEQQAFVQSLYYLTKSLDGTRLVIGNDGWEQVATDVITVHDYTSSGETLTERYGSRAAVERMLVEVQPSYRMVLLPGAKHQHEPVMVSEFGGITYDPNADDSWRHYGYVPTPEVLLERFRELVDALIDSEAIAGFCYTQLTDTQQERNGLLTEDRTPKVDPAEIRAIASRASAAVPGDAVNEFAYGDYREASRGGPAVGPHGAGESVTA